MRDIIVCSSLVKLDQEIIVSDISKRGACKLLNGDIYEKNTQKKKMRKAKKKT